jgi:sec-independent protein translocase protein TatB
MVGNVGGAEVLVIAVVALIVLGPERLADAARTAGKVMGELRQMSAGFQRELRTAMNEVTDTTTTTARRNVLGRDGAPPAGSVDDAIDAISGQGPPSRNGNGASPASAPRPRRTRPLRAGDVQAPGDDSPAGT